MGAGDEHDEPHHFFAAERVGLWGRPELAPPAGAARKQTRTGTRAASPASTSPRTTPGPWGSCSWTSTRREEGIENDLILILILRARLIVGSCQSSIFSAMNTSTVKKKSKVKKE